MFKRTISLVLCFVLCFCGFFGCQKTDVEGMRVFKSVLRDMNPSEPEKVPSPLVMPPAVTSLEAEKTSVDLLVGESIALRIIIIPDEAWNKKILFESSEVSVATVDEVGSITAVGAGECIVTVRSEEIPDVTLEIAVKVREPVIIKEPEPPVKAETPETNDSGGKETAEPVTAPTYINGILVVNKTYALPSDYNPGVDDEAYAALMQMFEAAKADGIGFWIASGFRSYARQNTIYNNYVAQDGKAAADRYSARPGHSEHQTGLAFDLNYLTQAFGQSPEGLWLAANCHRFGFIIRYPQGKEHITGYMYEPWHIRYLGVDVATAVYESGLTLEEYLGITSVYAEN